MRARLKERFWDRASTQGARQGAEVTPLLPRTDNEPGAPEALMAANAWWRRHPWPAPYDATFHRVMIGDARRLTSVPDQSVHLIVTSPPYFNLKPYASEADGAQLGRLQSYEAFLHELDKVWAACSCRAGASAASSATSWCRAAPDAIMCCRCPPIFRSAAAAAGWTI